MFKELSELLQNNETVAITITKTDTGLTAMVVPTLKDGKSNLKPFVASGLPEELDTQLIPTLAETINKLRKFYFDDSALMASAKEVEKPSKSDKIKANWKGKAKTDEEGDDEVDDATETPVKKEEPKVKEVKLNKTQLAAVKYAEDTFNKCQKIKDPMMIEYMSKMAMGKLKNAGLADDQKDVLIYQSAFDDLIKAAKGDAVPDDLPFTTQSEKELEAVPENKPDTIPVAVTPTPPEVKTEVISDIEVSPDVASSIDSDLF